MTESVIRTSGDDRLVDPGGGTGPGSGSGCTSAVSTGSADKAPCIASLNPATQSRLASRALARSTNQAWAEQSAPRKLAEAIAEWAVALMRRLWPDSAESWSVTVDTKDWYEAAYIDVAVRVSDRVWLLHLGVSD